MQLRHRQWKLGNCLVDEGRQIIAHNGFEISVRNKLLSTLVCLIEHHPKVVESDHLIDLVWGEFSSINKAGVNHTIWCLRQMLISIGVKEKLIETIPKRGYRINCRPVQQVSEAGIKALLAS